MSLRDDAGTAPFGDVVEPEGGGAGCETTEEGEKEPCWK